MPLKFYFSKRAKTLAALPRDSERWSQQEQRDRQLEYWLNRFLPNDGPPIFNYPGPLATDTSGPWEPYFHNHLVLSAVAKLGTAGSSTTTAHLFKNGVSIITFSLASSVTRDPHTLTAPIFFLLNSDNMSADISAAGTGAEDLVIQVGSVPIIDRPH